ncbi:VOC family protein [Aurantiacibacter gangjinensis]|uniref:Glyoxalase n=1 Tax=Aurantiacibacter gangjinensis TaxID=502682 RepID=A0A0G9MN65_9SPHN|nr:VOC family protein [Aurantiacibacter gangjinensis]APE28235.1 Glyoxalase family protein [Aurantiacibacter gangjinensis]KLE32132.1 glyoxalase [Aurantiacibacter gangjinensis]
MPSQARIEHINITVSDMDRSIALLESAFGWHVRIRAPHAVRGEFAHVGSEDNYVALWADGGDHSGQRKGKPLNHIGVQVDDLDAAEHAVIASGLEPNTHGTYDPGPSSFYFFDWDGIEFEVVSYA